jgi:hypothetical protein
MSVTQPAGHNVVARREALETGGTIASGLSEQTNLSENTNGEEDPDQAPRFEPKSIDVQPDGGYGWVVVACCFLINGTFSTYFIHMYVGDPNDAPYLNPL